MSNSMVITWGWDGWPSQLSSFLWSTTPTTRILPLRGEFARIWIVCRQMGIVYFGIMYAHKDVFLCCTIILCSMFWCPFVLSELLDAKCVNVMTSLWHWAYNIILLSKKINLISVSSPIKGRVQFLYSVCHTDRLQIENAIANWVLRQQKMLQPHNYRQIQTEDTMLE